jgi:hypothetical protein
MLCIRKVVEKVKACDTLYSHTVFMTQLRKKMQNAFLLISALKKQYVGTTEMCFIETKR